MIGTDGHEYFGVSELAEACGVTRQAVSNWLHRGTKAGKIPQPAAVLRSGAVWILTPELKKFIESKRQEYTRRP